MDKMVKIFKKHKSKFIGGGVGFLVGVIFFFSVLPILVFTGFFGSWLNFDNTSPLFYIEPSLDYPWIAVAVFVVLGVLIGSKNGRK